MYPSFRLLTLQIDLYTRSSSRAKTEMYAYFDSVSQMLDYTTIQTEATKQGYEA